MRSGSAGRAILLAIQLGWITVAFAQSSTNTPALTPSRNGEVVVPGTDSFTAGPGPGTSPIDSFDRTRLPQLLQDRVRQFEVLRDQYLQEQKDLARKLRGANEQDREKIREQIRERRQAWLELSRQNREQARDRLQELKTQLPRHREVLDAAREQAREGAREALQRTRERRGTD